MTGPPSGPPVATSRPPTRKSSWWFGQASPPVNQRDFWAGSAQAAKTRGGGVAALEGERGVGDVTVHGDQLPAISPFMPAPGWLGICLTIRTSRTDSQANT